MFAWIRNTQTEAEFWAFKCKQGVLGREIRQVLYSPGLRDSFWLKTQKDFLTVRNAKDGRSSEGR